MANSTDAEATLRKFVARINAHDPSGIIALCTIDHVFIDSLGSRLSGHKQLAQGWRGGLFAVSGLLHRGGVSDFSRHAPSRFRFRLGDARAIADDLAHSSRVARQGER